MARATYTPNAPLLLTNIQYNLTIASSICQRIAKGDKERFVMMLGAGQGKTLVFLLVCMMLMKDERTNTQFKKCCLITITKTLFTQL